MRVSTSIVLFLKCKCEIFSDIYIYYVQDAYEIQNKVLVHMLTYKDNEYQANIPQVVQDLVKRIGIDYFL